MTANLLKWCLFLIMLLAGTTVFGNETDRKKKGVRSERNAESLYRKGIDHFDAGEYQLALNEFREAYAIKASWKLLYNIGQSAAAGGDYGIALESFEGYLVGGQEDLSLERIDEVRDEINRLKIVVGYIEIKTRIAGRIFVDGYYRGDTPLAGVLPVTSGVRALEIKNVDDDEVIFTEEVSVVGEKTVEVVFEENADNPAAPVTDNTTTSAATNRTDSSPGDTAGPPNDASGTRPSHGAKPPSSAPGVVITIIGAAGLGVGTAFVFKNMIEQNDAENTTDQGHIDTYNNKVRPMNNIGAAVAYGVGAVALTTGIILLVRVQKKRQQFGAAQPTLFPSAGGLTVQF